jgi:hypothetical protein
MNEVLVSRSVELAARALARKEGLFPEDAVVEWNDLEPMLIYWQTFIPTAEIVINALLEEDKITVDLDKEFLKSLTEAAGESTWIPPEYYMNDWVSDCCDFLRTGEGIHTISSAFHGGWYHAYTYIEKQFEGDPNAPKLPWASSETVREIFNKRYGIK